ncbi:MAG: NAD(P)/FAD-dependent oxidoreductase [Alphaproteobacteria bacterium]|nr:NAD(P)/FAD-dependent oxidoreductase [Alphaproteobacteria bacterium]MBU1512858.1 NAD(P)/FAD-dependent oxidoreductase [Alphaproteobacteria bacterium]MBU2096701.1 NAD(P)/FAD-dependent oxidoreductase [Alphaproteobacteria bacterium]MBU2150584.1 NAD(P)/FAD-dependent oxidoreductase [Alphaproteobacteria bacterium]MBU2308082.1 NAD(P)/FAD-dependent oxidoreductase [Alphaproteobacteria bacterium]
MTTEHFDVVIVGAGLSGVGAGYHLKTTCPDRSFAILEGRDAIGGTWDLFRYPGIRSDSDMYTLGYAFKPWTEAKAIADGPSILNYVRTTASENGIDRHIRYGHMVKRVSWSTEAAAWTVEAEVAGKLVQYTCNFLFLCGGYYSYEGGYTPDYPGVDSFKGALVHPQKWPKDLDYAGKKVVVIGSGATAVTLVPEMAKTAAHVTMLQRSPTYVVSRPAEDKMANSLRKWLPGKLAYDIVRWRNVLFGMYFFKMAREKPAAVKANILKMVREQLGPDYDVDKHFTPTYNPWDQRLCLVPDADMFLQIKAGRASVVTDHIETFTPTGIRLKSGAEIEADVVVSATGLVLQVWNGVEVNVDGRRIDASQTFGYKGIMYAGVPNMASAFGYTNASWTLKCDLTCEFVCRVLNHMKKTGQRQVTPVNTEADIAATPWLDFSSGYVSRAMEKWPKQGSKAPWRLDQNYAKDLMNLRYAKLEDGVLRFSNRVGEGAKTPEKIAA